MQYSVLYGQVFLMMGHTSRALGGAPFFTKCGSRAGKYFPKISYFCPRKRLRHEKSYFSLLHRKRPRGRDHRQGAATDPRAHRRTLQPSARGALGVALRRTASGMQHHDGMGRKPGLPSSLAGLVCHSRRSAVSYVRLSCVECAGHETQPLPAAAASPLHLRLPAV